MHDILLAVQWFYCLWGWAIVKPTFEVRCWLCIWSDICSNSSEWQRRKFRSWLHRTIGRRGMWQKITGPNHTAASICILHQPKSFQMSKDWTVVLVWRRTCFYAGRKHGTTLGDGHAASANASRRMLWGAPGHLGFQDFSGAFRSFQGLSVLWFSILFIFMTETEIVGNVPNTISLPRVVFHSCRPTINHQPSHESPSRWQKIL